MNKTDYRVEDMSKHRIKAINLAWQLIYFLEEIDDADFTAAIVRAIETGDTAALDELTRRYISPVDFKE